MILCGRKILNVFTFPATLFRGCLVYFFCISALITSQGQGLLIPFAPTKPGYDSARREMVFDRAGRYLYISTSDGWIRRYNLTTRQIDGGYDLGRWLNGMDIALDDSCLIVGAGAPDDYTTPYGAFFRVDLTTGGITEIRFGPEPNSTSPNIGWDVAFASNGIALVSSSGPLRQIDLATNQLSVRNDVPVRAVTPYTTEKIGGSVRLGRTADGQRVLVGGRTVFNATTNSFAPLTKTGERKAAINRDGSIMASSHWPFSVSLESVPDYTLLRVFGRLGGGVAFDPLVDTLYVGSELTQSIIAYDTSSYSEKYRLAVGEDIYAIDKDFESEIAVSPNGKYLAYSTVSGVRVFEISPPPSQSPPPQLERPTDMVFDSTSRYLYIGTYRGFVWPYNLLAHQLEDPINLGGILFGMDISPDDSFLLVAQYYRGLSQGMFQKVDLRTRSAQNLLYDFYEPGVEQGSWDVAISANGLALATLHDGGNSGSTVLRQIDPAKGVISLRTDAPLGPDAGHGTASPITRSADRKRLVIAGANNSSGPLFSYDAMTDKFGPKVQKNTYWDQSQIAVNRDGSLFAYSGDVGLETLPNFQDVHTFRAGDSSHDPGVNFDPVSDTVYIVAASDRAIIAFDTTTFGERFRIPIGEAIRDYANQFDVGTLVPSPDGKYLALISETAVRVFDVATRAATVIPTLAGASPAAAGRLANLSTRALVQSGDNVAIAGFIVTGASKKRVVLRGIGPTLAAAGLQGALQDPGILLYDVSGSVIAANDNWRDTQAADIAALGLAPHDAREAAMIASLSPGSYTIALIDAMNGTGVGLIEVYDVDPVPNSTLANISTRALVGQDDNAMIAGVIARSASTKVVLRAIGPSLAKANVVGALQDPILEVHDSNGGLIAANDDWQDNVAPELFNSGLFPTDPRESAVFAVLPVGSYTAVVRGKKNSTGIGLVEAYTIQ